MTGVVKMILLCLLAAALLSAGAVSMFRFQDRQIYNPENPPRAALIAEGRKFGMTPWPGAKDFRGFLLEPPGTVRGTVVLFHGNSGTAVHRLWYSGVLAPFGLRVIVAEYPGFGSRPGKVGEKSLVADAREILGMARRMYPGPLLLVGESLGTGVAGATAEDAGADAVLLLTPFDRIASVAGHLFPGLPVRWLLRDRYDSAGSLSGYRGRVAVVIAERDEVVPPESGQRLYDGFPGPKRLWVVPGAGHCDWMDRIDAAWWRSVVGFLVDGAESPDLRP